MGLLLNYQWEIFIALEVISGLSLLIFGVVRYFFNKQRLSLLFLLLFIILLILEALLGLLIYRETGEISTFLIIITVFVIYACTFGIFDFMKLDRWMRQKIGGWRGVQLLTEKDIRIINRQKDPKYIAKKYRRSSTVHLIIFASVQAVFWIYGTGGTSELLDYLKDLSWIGTDNAAETPYANDTIYRISMIWGLVFIIDFIWSWSYTVFPASKKG
ncbi:hypothetical protein NSQ77_11940 [Oceanobacillus sp. FSL K6-2867]|uniref:hypothetical protein n=1 Tax=Oceanobacillus sp. FSL K6-2867 TaxID=2954748 RepID=UPI0030D7F42A